MQDTKLREITQSPAQQPRRRGPFLLAIAIVALIGLIIGAVALVGGDSDSEAEAAAGTTAVTTTTTRDSTTATSGAAPGTTAAVPGNAEPVWPTSRYLTTTAFDEGSGLLVVFGGTRFEDIGFSDTWVFDPSAGTWTEQDPEVRPPGRMTAAMAYDPGLDRLVMFGGAADRSYVWDDLWLYDVDADVWERVEVEGPRPSARAYASMTYVDSLGGMLLFGGNTGWFLGQGEFGDTWFLDTATMTWTEVEGEGPGARDMAGMAYDPVEDKVVLAGGFQPADSLTWIFDPETMEWTPGADVSGPLSRLEYDAATGQMVSTGLAYSVTTDTWTTSAWDPSMRADGYVGSGPFLDARRGVAYFFMVHFDPRLETEMWQYDLDTGTLGLIEPGGIPDAADTRTWPPERWAESTAFDEQSGKLVVFGGASGFGDLGSADTWVYDPVAGTWEQRHPDTAPGVRFGAGAAYDPGLDRVVLFGGIADQSWVWDDVWLYDVDADVWEQADIAGPRPGPRTYFDMVYVDSLGGMLVYGGSKDYWVGQNSWEDTWLLDTSTMTWTEIAADGPGPWDYTSLAYDPRSDTVAMSVASRSGNDPVWIFDAVSMAWNPGSAVPMDAIGGGVVYGEAVGLIVAPGFTYDPAADVWTAIAWGTELEGALVAGDQAILIVGDDAVWEYDLVGQIWRRNDM